MIPAYLENLANSRWVKEEFQAVGRQLGEVLHLSPEFRLLETLPAKPSSLGYAHCHIHNLFLFEKDGQLGFAKAEEVYLPAQHEACPQLSKFADFVESLFQSGESTLASKELHFPEDPEIPTLQLDRYTTLQALQAQGPCPDSCDPSQIEDWQLRKLYHFYKSLKDSQLSLEQQRYTRIFTRHGLDLIGEVLGSALARIVGAPAPNNRFALGPLILINSKGEPRFSALSSRYLYSMAIENQKSAPNLETIFQQLESQNFGGQSDWHYANPCNLERLPQNHARLGLLRKTFPHFCDLAASDLVDQFLGGSWDRSLQEFLLPQGPPGRIYTLDFGECLFAALRLNPGDPHLSKALASQQQNFVHFLRLFLQLSAAHPMAQRLTEGLVRLLFWSPENWEAWIQTVPSEFLSYRLQEEEGSLRFNLLHYLLGQRALAMEELELEEGLAPHRMHALITERLR